MTRRGGPTPGGQPEPGCSFAIEPMRAAEMDAIMAIEEEAFRNPWPAEAFLDEIRIAGYSRCLVSRATEGGVASLAGYICYWILEGELMINNLAVAAAWRRRGVARSLLRHALEEARRLHCAAAYLEVRPSNEAAQALYAAEGFRMFSRRRGYYSDTGEDALVLRLDF